MGINVYEFQVCSNFKEISLFMFLAKLCQTTGSTCTLCLHCRDIDQERRRRLQVNWSLSFSEISGVDMMLRYFVTEIHFKHVL